jgi:hypothetical protein
LKLTAVQFGQRTEHHTVLCLASDFLLAHLTISHLLFVVRCLPIRAAMTGNPPALTKTVGESQNPLTQRETGTVRVHVHAILQKLEVRDRTQAAVLAIQKGLVAAQLLAK